MNKKVVIIISILVLVVVGITIPFLLSNLNAIVAKAIERNGSEVTDTSVGVSGVDISLREGKGSIKGLRIANPEGFHARDAFTLGNITVDIDLESVTKNPIVLDEIRIEAPVVIAEVTKKGESNIEALRERVQSYTGGGGGGNKGGDGDSKRIRIKRFVFEAGSIEVDASAFGVEKRTVKLPEIRMSDVGGASGGTPDEIAKEILTAVTRKVTTEIASSEVDRILKKRLGDESVTDKAKGLLDKIGK